jgi:hypothetical protein
MTTGSTDDGQGVAGSGDRRLRSLLTDWLVWGLIALGVLMGFLVGRLASGKPRGLPPAWGDVPTWVSGIAAIGLLTGAYFTAKYAIKAFGTQSEQLRDQKKLNAKQTVVLGVRPNAEELATSANRRQSGEPLKS